MKNFLRSLAVGLALCPASALAQSNFEAAQIGGRTTMMGGAAVALGADEATAFMNPAGITRIPGQSFSFSTFAVTTGNRTIQNALDPEGRLDVPESTVGQLQLRIVPNTFCLFLNGPPRDQFSRRSRHKYAFCATATERERMEFADNRIQSQFGSSATSGVGHVTRMEFVRSTMAVAWGLELSPKTSVGVTWRVDNSRFADSTAASAYVVDGDAGRLQTLQLSRDAWSWDTALVLGLTTNISRSVTLGVSFSTPSQHLMGSYTGLGALGFSAGAAGLIQDEGDFRYNVPASVRLGLGFTWPRLTFEVNGAFYGPQTQRARANFDRTGTFFTADQAAESATVRGSVAERGIPVTNISAGLEYFLQRDFSVISGLQTDFSGITDRQDQLLTEVLFRQKKDAIHAAMGVSSYGSMGRLLLGLRGTYAWGQALIADPTLDVPRFDALKQTEWGLSLVLSGRISFRAVRDTAARVAEPITNTMESDEGERP